MWKFGLSANAGVPISVGPSARIRMGSLGTTFFCQIDDNAPAAMTLTTNEFEKTPVMYTSRMPASSRTSTSSTDYSRLKTASVLPTRMMSPGSRVFFGTLWPLT